MIVEITKHTDVSLAHEAIAFTTGHTFDPKAELIDIYGWGHSLTYTQMFTIRMYKIPSFVSVHFVRHHVGVCHYVKSMRDDRQPEKEVDRNTPVNHMMFCNAEAVMAMARRRLCGMAHKNTRIVMEEIKRKMQLTDPALADMLVPTCVYRNGVCPEPKPCNMARYWGISNAI